MLLGYMTCTEMYGNGATIGRENILQILKQIPKALCLELSMYYEAVLLSMFYQAADLPIALLCILQPTKTIIMDFA